MAGSSRKKSDNPSGAGAGAGSLPADFDLETLYGAVGGRDEAEEEAELIIVPPVRLLPREELAAAALGVPLLSAAIRLARWITPFRPVDEWGELGSELETQAAMDLDLVPEDGDADVALGKVAAAWALAVDLELIRVGDADPASGEGEGEVARPGAELEVLERGDTDSVLEAWETAASIVAGTAVEAEIDLGVEPPAEAAAKDPDEETESEYAELEEAREETQGLLDDALQVLYETRAFAATEAEQTIPLGVLAALLVVPDGQEPDAEMLGDITSVMVTLDPMLQDLADIGMLEYRPIDPTLFAEGEGEGEEEEPGPDTAVPEVDAEQAARFGLARLTPLGVHGVRQWLLEDGYDAPLVGVHAQGDAAELLEGICGSANVLPEEEIREWLSGREPLLAATELLAAARGNDFVAPIRRMFCARALDHLGGPAEPSVRAVLADPELGGLATAWLTAQGATGLPELSPDVRLWNTIDTVAAHLIDSAEREQVFRELVVEVTGGRPSTALFAELWRVDHPYTTAVLDAIGEVHPDKATAKEARKAAYKARSKAGSQQQG